MSVDLNLEIADLTEDEKKEKENDANLYRSCCGPVSDKRLLTFISMFSISIIALGFSFASIAHGGLDKDDKLFYTGLISLIIGVWVRTPV